MPLAKIPIAPGIDKQDTAYGAQGKWFDGDNIRFRYSLPEKIGGWAKVTTDALVGATRGIVTWFTLDGVRYTMMGTNKKLYAYSEGAWGDITPERSTGDSITQFATTDGSDQVSVTDAAHGARAGDFVTITSATPPTSSSLSAANLQGEFEIQSITSVDIYIITAGASESSGSDRTGGSATAAYQINTGPALSLFGYGWGAGTWDLHTWGTTREGLTGASGVELDSAKWSLDNWGEDTLACFHNGSLYYWDVTSGVSSNRATIVTNAPATNRFVIVSGTDRHVILFGTIEQGGSTQDNMLVRWSDQEDYTTWAATTTNTAGSQRLTDGSRLVTARRSRGAVLIWSDTALYQMQLIGAPFTFGFSQLGANCGCVGLHAAVDVNGQAFWMGTDSFFKFDGRVAKIQSSVEDYVFDDISTSNKKDIFCASNSEFNEVSWFYASSTATQIDRVVTYNYVERVWSVGSLARSSWVDKGVYPYPYATTYSPADTTTTISTINGLTAGRTYLYAQENGDNDDGSAMTAYIESGDFVFPEAGQYLMSVSRFIPDFKNLSGTVNVSLKFRDYPASSQRTNGPFAVTSSTTKVDTRARGRQGSIRIESDAINTAWRYGTYRADVRQDGMR
jgi:hypothetical protein